MDADESSQILQELFEHMLKPDFVYQHRWTENMLVLWDNRVLLHAATPFDAEKHTRLIYRAGFSGEPVYL